MEEHKIIDFAQFKELWEDIYGSSDRPSWDGIIPYYADDIYFRDSVQEIRGIERFTEMTTRLARRSRNLQFIIHRGNMEGNLIFIEWEMIIAYKRFPKASVYGASRILLRDGKVAEQRDYYDLWGDIYDNIPVIAPIYRTLMKWWFG